MQTCHTLLWLTFSAAGASTRCGQL